MAKLASKLNSIATRASVWVGFFVCTAGIAFLNYLLLDVEKLGRETWIFVSSLQALGSSLVGYYLFPRIFGNDQLRAYQKSVAKNTFTVLISPNPDAAKILIMTGMQDNLSDMPHALIQEVINEQDALSKVLAGSFGAGDREKAIIKVKDIYERVLEIEQDEDFVSGNSHDSQELRKQLPAKKNGQPLATEENALAGEVILRPPATE